MKKYVFVDDAVNALAVKVVKTLNGKVGAVVNAKSDFAVKFFKANALTVGAATAGLKTLFSVTLEKFEAAKVFDVVGKAVGCADESIVENVGGYFLTVVDDVLGGFLTSETKTFYSEKDKKFFSVTILVVKKKAKLKAFLTTESFEKSSKLFAAGELADWTGWYVGGAMNGVCLVKKAMKDANAAKGVSMTAVSEKSSGLTVVNAMQKTKYVVSDVAVEAAALLEKYSDKSDAWKAAVAELKKDALNKKAYATKVAKADSNSGSDS